MKLGELFKGIEQIEIEEKIIDIEIKSIEYDSRKVVPGSLFVCIEGYKLDGHEFINDAIEKGAVAVLISKDVHVPGGTAVIKHSNTRKALAEISSNFYGNPSRKMNLVGVTGTKGKTTTTFMIKSILECAGHKVGLIGTIANCVGDKVLSADRTTPESLELQELFLEMHNEGLDTVVMEVSSHSLELFRVYSCDFDIGIFTNLSRDHLDFHRNFENYFAAKAKLFNISKKGAANIDDEYGKQLIDQNKCEMISFGINNGADINAENINISSEGTTFKAIYGGDSLNVDIPIPGKFSVYNALAAIAACRSLGAGKEDIVEGLRRTKVPGRAEIVPTNDNFTVMVDYAHSPDSLENILQAVKVFAKGRIVVIFGCGGDRDRTKRPIMGEIAGRLADFTIITSDNPRSEEPEVIIIEVEEGIKRTKGEYIILSDRREAIEYAVKTARENDIIVIAGKGHETYQIQKDKTVHFDDREIAREVILSTRNKD